MNIDIKTIAHKRQRYNTCGDWWWEDNTLVIRVSCLGDWRYELLVGFHELIECAICKFRGITQAEVDSFDFKFESDRKKGKHKKDAEPGDHPDAPYRIPHFFATTLERMLALMLGVDWEKYADAVEAL